MARARRKLLLAACAWFALSFVGLAALSRYAGRAGEAAAPAIRWPANSPLKPDPTKFSLVLFLHPRCGCSAATLSELERLLPRIEAKSIIHIVFVQPEGRDVAWVKGDLWRRAAAIPFADLRIDPENSPEYDGFAAKTSGSVLLYDNSGRLRFSGGITPARGHEGNSAGRAALLDTIEGRRLASTEPFEAPVFGCALKRGRP